MKDTKTNRVKLPEDKKILDTEEIIKRHKQELLDSTSVNYSDIFNISKHIKDKISSNQDINDIFPDIALSIEIIVSSILSPNEMLKPTLSYKLNKINLPVTTTSYIVRTIKDHLKDNYKLQDRLYNIIEESMFTKGAYAELLVPTSMVYDLYKKRSTKLTVGLESAVDYSMKKHSGKFIKKKVLYDGILTVSDNLTILNSEEQYSESIEDAVTDVITGKRSSIDDEITAGFENAVNRKEILSLYNDDKSEEKPIIRKIPVESVIPVINPNDPSKHYGYFIILDNVGTPVANGASRGLGEHLFNDLSKSESKEIISNAKKLISEMRAPVPRLTNVQDIHEALIIKQLENSLKDTKFNGLGRIEVEGRAELLDIMLDRLLKREKTNVIFVPENLLAYYAYRYRANGTGESILEKITILSSIRVITLFTSLLAHVKSNIPITRVEATIDEENPDYEKTMEKIITEVMQSRQMNLPIGILKVDDVVDWVHKIGFSFDFNHPGLPDTKINITEDTYDIKPIDDDLKEQIDKHIIRAMGLTPEIVDNSYGPDFATTIVANNILLARRIASYQKVYNKLITSHIRKILQVDGELKKEIRGIVEKDISSIRKALIKDTNDKDRKLALKNVSDDDLVDYVYYLFTKNIDVTLPEPEVSDSDNMGELFNKFKDGLDDFVDLIINDDVLPNDLLGDFSDKIDTMKNLIKAILIKRWANEHGYMDEVMSMFSIGNDGKPIFDILDEYKAHINILETSLFPFIKEMTKTKDKLDDKLDKIENGEEDKVSSDVDNENSDENSEEKI